MPVVIVGNAGGSNIGQSLADAAQELNVECVFLNALEAFNAPKAFKVMLWRLFGKRPPHLVRFSRQVARVCLQAKPTLLLTTGLAPLSMESLSRIGEMGIIRVNFLTDDPWNPAHSAQWFFRALLQYEAVFSPRQANLTDLQKLGVSHTHYLPFGYDPKLFHPQPLDCRNSDPRWDIVFAGTGDSDRIPFIHALIKSGLNVGLYGAYWERYSETKSHSHGQASPTKLRQLLINSKVALCLVRRANRDGNVMRSFEVPATGACMLTEDTLEHREIFGADGEAVVYFRTIAEMVERAKWLLQNDEERLRLAQTAHRLVVNGRHTYKDRLITILETIKQSGY